MAFQPNLWLLGGHSWLFSDFYGFWVKERVFEVEMKVILIAKYLYIYL